MQSAKYLIALSLALFVSACGVEPDERVYGTWVEPLTGELVQFRENGTLGWFGVEGTFAFKKSSNWASCFGSSGCPTGQVAVDVDGQSFRISYYSDRFDAKPDQWYLHFRNFAAIPYDVTIGSKTSGGFTIYRDGTISAPLSPPGFKRMDNGLSALHPSPSAMQIYNGKIFASIEGYLMRWDARNEIWVTVKNNLESWDMILDPEVIRSEEEYSLDGGNTWRSLPALGDDNREGDAVAMGTTLYASVRVDHEDSPTYRQIWAVDLTASAPAWGLVGQIPASDYESRELITIPQAQTLVRSMWLPGRVELTISADLGITWAPLDSQCSDHPQAHTNGIFCRTVEGSIQWFSLTTASWSTVTASDDGQFVKSSRLRDALYIVRNDALVKISQDGSETVLTQLGDGPGWSGDVYLLDQYVVLNKLSIWLKSL